MHEGSRHQAPFLVRCTTLCLAAHWLLLVACSSRETSSEPSCISIKPTTVCDPSEHPVAPFSCATAANCPGGTVCQTLPDEGDSDTAVDAWPASDVTGEGVPFPAFPSDFDENSCRKTCQIPDPNTSNRHALTSGFGVSQFELSPLIDGSGPTSAFTWNAPQRSRVVHCALFTCRPVIEQTLQDDRRIATIVNFDHCVIASKLFQSSEGVIDLGDPNIVWPQDDADEDPAPSDPVCTFTLPRRVSELSVGCWAFDASRIIAATPLGPVDPSEIFNYHDLFDLDCTSGFDDRICIFAGDNTWGSCQEGDCRRACIDHRDCSGIEELTADTDESDTGAPDDMDAGPAEPRCLKKKSDYVGICIADTANIPAGWH